MICDQVVAGLKGDKSKEKWRRCTMSIRRRCTSSRLTRSALQDLDLDVERRGDLREAHTHVLSDVSVPKRAPTKRRGQSKHCYWL